MISRKESRTNIDIAEQQTDKSFHPLSLGPLGMLLVTEKSGSGESIGGVKTRRRRDGILSDSNDGWFPLFNVLRISNLNGYAWTRRGIAVEGDGRIKNT